METQTFLVGDTVWWLDSVGDAVAIAIRDGTLDVDAFLKSGPIWCCEQARDGTLQYKLYYENSKKPGNQKEVYWEAGSRLYHHRIEAVRALKKRVAQGLLERRERVNETLSNIQQVLAVCEG